jgi:hypothetical protein
MTPGRTSATPSPTRGLHSAPLPQPGPAVASRGGWLHRRREVDLGQRPRGTCRHPGQRHPATTRQPILLHHPAEGRWFEDQGVLPSLSRIRGTLNQEPLRATQAGPAPDPAAVTSMVLVADAAVAEGIALIDAPDVDSVSADNRKLTGQLLAAADPWVFVTTANRYADAVPWRLLLDAASQDITVAVVLDRVPSAAEAEVSADLQSMLSSHGLGRARLFVVPEAPLDGMGMLPSPAVEPLRLWLQDLAADAAGRAEIARRTLSGTVKALGGAGGGCGGGCGRAGTRC